MKIIETPPSTCKTLLSHITSGMPFKFVGLGSLYIKTTPAAGVNCIRIGDLGTFWPECKPESSQVEVYYPNAVLDTKEPK